MSILRSSCQNCGRFNVGVLVLVGFVFLSSTLLSQTTISTGSIQGTVTDPSGAVVSGAKVTISNKDTGQSINLTTTSSGAYNSGAFIPGDYVLRVEMKGFKTVTVPVTVQVGVTSLGNVKLEVGQENQIVEVQAGAVSVTTEQATVQGVISSQQIENLPINGRNFLELAQLEPGVQIQDGSNFDPTKLGYTGISIGGRQGRTTRIEVDGVDISDETVGTTTQNISVGSIQEFSISQSSLDLSTELTSSGAVNVVTKSGTNGYHGEGFYLFRDKRAGMANFPGGQDLPFQRNHFGGSFGGPILKDKLFFFINGERNKQAGFFPLTFPAPLNVLNGGFSAPYTETEAFGRLDYTLKRSARLFYKFTYDNNNNVNNFRPDYQAFVNRDNVPSQAVGVDFNTGEFTHSVRFGYLKFVNHIADAASTAPVDPLPGINLQVRPFRSGPNSLAPQATFQRNLQVKYDGSRIWGSHIFRYGIGLNKILGGGFANFVGLAPIMRSTYSQAPVAATGPFPGGDTNPLNYPLTRLFLGNGQGFFTEKPEFGLPAGGQYDSRFQWYIGDTWKIRPNLSLTYGLRYVRDTGRTDSDLASIPCSAIDPTQFAVPVPCNGNLLDNFGNIPGLGNRVRQPNSNFGPQIGFAWDPFKNGKTVIRGGAGIYYENAVFNNVLFDRPVRLANGLFNIVTSNICPSGVVPFPGGASVTSINGKDIATQICGQPIGLNATDVADLQAQFQAATAAAGVSANPGFVGVTLSPANTGAVYAPNYRTPRSYQMNIGVQRELGRGTVLSADYVRNVSLRYLLQVDTNHVGDARYLNTTAAQNAISGTNSAFGCPADTASTSIDCAITNGAVIDDYASFGLDSAANLIGPCPAESIACGAGIDPAFGAAFAGINPFYGQNAMLFPVGRSVYNGLQVSLKERVVNPMPGMKNLNLQVSYALSRFKTMAADQDFIELSFDQANATRYFGPASFDRTHQLAFGAVMEISRGPIVSFAAHFNTALPATPILEDQFRAGEIFHTDLTGDGTAGDIITGANIGSFGRDIKVADLNKVINSFNSNFAGKLTPAGQALVDAGLFTQSQLVSLGAVIDTVANAPAGQKGLGPLRALDFKLSWPLKIWESLRIEPGVSFYNIFNFANFDASPATRLDGTLSGQPGSINGTTSNDDRLRAGLGSGVFAAGAPRAIEFGLRLTF